ncbi:hypothetical protein FXO37_04260 [Capsicum annuum]|nr:hypothetical protein FXO37_04260 [Capsicum annuum]
MPVGNMEVSKWFNMVNGKALESPLKPITGWVWIILAYNFDPYDLIWEVLQLPEWDIVTTRQEVDHRHIENDYYTPTLVMGTAATPLNSTTWTLYTYMHFAEMASLNKPNQARKFDVLINGDKQWRTQEAVADARFSFKEFEILSKYEDREIKGEYDEEVKNGKEDNLRDKFEEYDDNREPEVAFTKEEVVAGPISGIQFRVVNEHNHDLLPVMPRLMAGHRWRGTLTTVNRSAPGQSTLELFVHQYELAITAKYEKELEVEYRASNGGKTDVRSGHRGGRRVGGRGGVNRGGRFSGRSIRHKGRGNGLGNGTSIE